MNAPITWRNIEIPDFRGAAAGMATVSNNLEAARKLFTQSIADTERIDAENWDNTKNNNTNAVLNHLMSFGDLESFEKAKASGEFQNLMSQYGAQIDANRVREVMDNRGDLLRRRAIEALDHQNRVRTEEEAKVAREQKPILDRLLGLIEQGEDLKNVTGAARIYADSGMLREDFLRQILEAARKREEGIDDRARQRLLDEARIRAQNAQAAAARAQADAARARADDPGRPPSLPSLSTLASTADKWYEDWVKNSILGRGTLDTPEGRDAMGKVIETFKLTPNATQDVWENLEKRFPGGYYTRIVNGKEVRLPIPVELVHEALRNTDEFWDGGLVSTRGNKAVDYIQNRLENPHVVQGIADAIRIRDWRKALQAQVGTDPNVAAVMPSVVFQGMRQWGQPPLPKDKK